MGRIIQVLYEAAKLNVEYKKTTSICKQIFIHLVKFNYSDKYLQKHHFGDIKQWLYEVYKSFKKNKKK